MNVIISVLIFAVVAYVCPKIFAEYADRLGVFFGWEIGTIAQTMFSFIKFSDQNRPSVMSDKTIRNINYIVLIILLIPMASFGFCKYHIIAEYWNYEQFTPMEQKLYILFTDAITIIPMVVFFLLNIIFYLIMKRGQRPGSVNIDECRQYNVIISRLIHLVDIPCLFPYLLILGFALCNFYIINDVGVFISGAGSILLLISNILTMSIDRLSPENE